MKILITGICGFVGSTIARAWLDAEPGLQVYGIDNFIRPGSEANRGDLQRRGINLFHGDIRVASDFETLPAVDWVIDAAANPSVLAGVDGVTSSRQLVEHNLQGTLNILEYCKRHRAGFLLLSTSRVYSIRGLSQIPVQPANGAFRICSDRPAPPGVSEEGVSEEFSTEPPISLYGSSKLASELLALEFGHTFGFPVWINRCGVLAGAGQFGRPDQGIFAYWINAWRGRRPLKYIGFGGSGYQVRDCLHPRDLVPVLRHETSSLPDPEHRAINLSGGRESAISLLQLSDWCRERFGQHEVKADLSERQFDVPWVVLDSTAGRQRWNWRPDTRLSDILEEIATHAEAHPDWLRLSGVS